jgi:flagellar FliL protein
MAEEAKEESVAKPSGGGSSGNKNALVTLLLVVNAVVMGAVGFIQFQAAESEKTKPSVQEIVKQEMKKVEEGEEEGVVEIETEGILLPLNPFTANLAQGDGPRRYVRMNLVLKFNKEAKEEEFNSRKPQIRDSIISILNTKRPEDLLKVEGKSILKEEIKSSINSFLIDGNIMDMYYVSFQIN